MATEALAPRRAGTNDHVVALRHMVSGECWVLPVDAAVIAVGSAPSCSVRVGDASVSAVHALLERYGETWRLVDRSRNGTFVGGQRVAALDLEPGARFDLGRTPMLALSRAMNVSAPRLGVFLGLDQPAAVSTAMIAADLDGTVAIIGPSGNGQRDLAGLLHSISRRRTQPLIELTGPEANARWARARDLPAATAYLDLATCTNLEAVAAARRGMLGDARWRWILAGGTEAHIAGRLQLPHLRSAHLIVLGRLDERTDDRMALVDAVLRETAPVTVAELPARAARTLTTRRAYASLDELRKVTRRVASLAMTGITPNTAQRLGMHPEHLALFAEKLGFPPGPRR